jgi:hypothetical protein
MLGRLMKMMMMVVMRKKGNCGEIDQNTECKKATERQTRGREIVQRRERGDSFHFAFCFCRACLLLNYSCFS